MQGSENAGLNMCRCWKGAKLGYERLFCSFERIGSLGPLFRSDSSLACSLMHVRAYMLVYSSVYLCSSTGGFSGVFSPDSVFLSEQNCVCFGTVILQHHPNRSCTFKHFRTSLCWAKQRALQSSVL